MRVAGLRGVCHQRKHRHFKPDPATHDDLVKRQFRAEAPDRIWFTDITQHRAAGLLGSMGRVASSVDNALVESFWSTMQRELLDRRSWTSRTELASAIFEWIEAWYNPRRRHSALGYLSPVEYEALHTTVVTAA